MQDRRFRTELAQLSVDVQELESVGEGSSMESAGPAFEYASEGELYRELTRIWREGSLQMSRLAGANGIAHYHFLQPNQYVRGSKPMSSQEIRVAIDPKHPYRHGAEKGYPHLRDAGRKLVRDGVGIGEIIRADLESRRATGWDE